MEDAYPVVVAYRDKVLDFLKNSGVATEETKIFPIRVKAHQKRIAGGYTTSEVEAFELNARQLKSNRKMCRTYRKIPTAITNLTRRKEYG